MFLPNTQFISTKLTFFSARRFLAVGMPESLGYGARDYDNNEKVIDSRLLFSAQLLPPESLIYMGEIPASAGADSRLALCEFEKTDVGATLFGKQIRVDDTGELLSVKDAIEVIEGCSSKAATMKMKKLINDGKISEATNPDFEYFKDGRYR